MVPERFAPGENGEALGAGDTGTSPGAGTTSELLGLGCGVGALTVGGGNCAAAPLADNSSTVSARQWRRIAFIDMLHSVAPVR